MLFTLPELLKSTRSGFSEESETKREDGAKPSRARRCNRGRNRYPVTVFGWEDAGSRSIREPEDLPDCEIFYIFGGWDGRSTG